MKMLLKTSFAKNGNFVQASMLKLNGLSMFHMFGTEKRESPWCQLCRQWQHRNLLLWQPPVSPNIWRFDQHKVDFHDGVIKWKHFQRYWPFERGIHQSPVSSLHKGQWRGALIFSLIYAWTNDWVNSRDAGDLRRHRAHYDVTVMLNINNGKISHMQHIYKDLSANVGMR